MRPPRWTVLLSLMAAPALLAGCTGPEGAEATQPSQSLPVGEGSGTAFRGPAGFVVEGLAVTPASGQERPLREDDAALVRYVIKQPADAANASTALVSFLLNGQVEDVQSVTLAPGQSRSFERRVDDVRNHTALKVEVRAGGSVAKAEAAVSAWPRMGEWVAFDDYFRVNVDGRALDETTGETVVRVTVTRGTQPFQEFRAHLLCLDAQGAVKSQGVSRPELQPQPGAAEVFELRFPSCAEATYGVDFKADVEGGKNVYGRVLFVPKGWKPGDATA